MTARLRLLGHPSRSGVRGNTGQVHPAGVELDEDRDVQPAQEDGVEGQKVRRQHLGRLSSKEGSSREAEPPASRARRRINATTSSLAAVAAAYRRIPAQAWCLPTVDRMNLTTRLDVSATS